MDGSLFTWGSLAAMGGASLLTFLIVMYTKSVADKIFTMPTDLYAVIVAFLILSAAQIAVGGSFLDWKLYGLSFANAFLIAATAGQMHNKSVNPPTLNNKSDSNES
jgi:hypothetical protein